MYYLFKNLIYVFVSLAYKYDSVSQTYNKNLSVFCKIITSTRNSN